jgi:hypothetical protein
MTANAINAKSEALDLHELSSEELDAVSGGMDTNCGTSAQAMANQNAQAAADQAEYNRQISMLR